VAETPIDPDVQAAQARPDQGTARSPDAFGTGAREVWSVVLAAGSGSRFGAAKQFLDLAGRSVLNWSVSTAASVSAGVVIVVPDSEVESAREGFAFPVVAGGATRMASAAAGVAMVPSSAEVILIHDAARPLASSQLFQTVAAAVGDDAKAVVPVVEVTDTIRNLAGEVVDRGELRAVQTPQGFDANVLRHAHERLRRDAGIVVTDDASYVQAGGIPLTMVEGESTNIKITNPTDLAVAEALLEVVTSGAANETSEVC
jgi:2-C-methyl-D-erythritol 4-phosphate cytidylyltransferase